MNAQVHAGSENRDAAWWTKGERGLFLLGLSLLRVEFLLRGERGSVEVNGVEANESLKATIRVAAFRSQQDADRVQRTDRHDGDEQQPPRHARDRSADEHGGGERDQSDQ